MEYQGVSPVDTASYNGSCDCSTIGLTEQSIYNFEVFPNPTSGLLKIVGLNAVIELEQISIFTSTGRIVRTMEEVENELNVSELPTGVYFLKILHESGVETIRFVKE